MFVTKCETKLRSLKLNYFHCLTVKCINYYNSKKIASDITISLCKFSRVCRELENEQWRWRWRMWSKGAGEMMIVIRTEQIIRQEICCIFIVFLPPTSEMMSVTKLCRFSPKNLPLDLFCFWDTINQQIRSSVEFFHVVFYLKRWVFNHGEKFSLKAQAFPSDFLYFPKIKR